MRLFKATYFLNERTTQKFKMQMKSFSNKKKQKDKQTIKMPDHKMCQFLPNKLKMKNYL
jgi:hypothetical protein